MVIDTHIHPALFAPICEDQERFRRRCDAMNYHLMKPSDMALLRKQYALADIGRVVLLPEDCSVESGMVEISTMRSQSWWRWMHSSISVWQRWTPAAPMLCRSWNVPLLSWGWPDLQ